MSKPLFNSGINTSEAKDILFAWKEAQENHRHLNVILFQLRNIAFVFAGAVLGGTGTLLKLNADSESSRIRDLVAVYKQGGEVPQDIIQKLQTAQPDYSGLLLIAASMVWIGLFLLDRYYYHMLLVGATKYAKTLEDTYPDIRLSGVIEDVNRSTPFPLIRASKGRAKVTVFYSIPLSIFLGFGIPLSLVSLGYLAGAKPITLIGLGIISMVVTWIVMLIIEVRQKE